MHLIQVKEIPKLLNEPLTIARFTIKIRDTNYDGLAIRFNDRTQGFVLKDDKSTFIIGWRDFLKEYADLPVIIEKIEKLTEDDIQKYLPIIIRLQEIQNSHPLRRILPKHVEVEVPPVELKSTVQVKIPALTDTQKRLINTVIAGINKDDYVRLKDVLISGSTLETPATISLEGTIFAKTGANWIPYLFNELESSLERVFNKPVKVITADLYVLMVKTLPATTTSTVHI